MATVGNVPTLAAKAATATIPIVFGVGDDPVRLRPNSGANPPIGWRMHRESNVDRQKVEMVAVQAIKGGTSRLVSSSTESGLRLTIPNG